MDNKRTDDLIKHQQAESERLKPLEKFSEFNSHIRVEDMLVCANSLGEWLEFCDNLKAEAYKELADKLDTYIIWHFSIDDPFVKSIRSKLDNLLIDRKSVV